MRSNDLEEIISKTIVPRDRFSLKSMLAEATMYNIIRDDDTFSVPDAIGELTTIKKWIEEIIERLSVYGCTECEREGDAPHTADCEVALAQDYADGSIRKDDPVYQEAKRIYDHIRKIEKG